MEGIQLFQTLMLRRLYYGVALEIKHPVDSQKNGNAERPQFTQESA